MRRWAAAPAALRPAGRPARHSNRRNSSTQSHQPPVSTGSSSSHDRPSRRVKTAVFFPGHGVQRIGMVKPWLDAFPGPARRILDQIDDALEPVRPPSIQPLSTIIESGPNSALAATEHAQPAIMASSVLILRLLESEFGLDFGRSVDYTLGHSLGEFAALVAAGYIRFDDAIRLVQQRATAMADATSAAMLEPGATELGMVALVCENEERLLALIDDLDSFVRPAGSRFDDEPGERGRRTIEIANINSKTQLVLSGRIDAIKTMVANLRQFGGHDPRAVRLAADAPFHSHIMAPACAVVRQILTRDPDMIRFPTTDCNGGPDQPAFVPCISNITAEPFTSRAQIVDLLARQCVETVRWRESVQYLDRVGKVGRWIGIGPGKVGRNLVGKEVGYTGAGAGPGEGVWAITSPLEAAETMRAWQKTDS